MCERDSGRTADHFYEWTKNGALAKLQTPSSAIIGWTFGTTGDNSDTDLITQVWRTSTATFVHPVVAWNPYGPLEHYQQKNKTSNIQLRTRFLRNLAYRITNIYDQEPTSGGGAAGHSIAITEDAKGRVVTRDYTPSDPTLAGLYDSYFLYDMQDRVTCETTTSQSTCPTTGSGIRKPGRPVHERRRLEQGPPADRGQHRRALE